MTALNTGQKYQTHRGRVRLLHLVPNPRKPQHWVIDQINTHRVSSNPQTETYSLFRIHLGKQDNTSFMSVSNKVQENRINAYMYLSTLCVCEHISKHLCVPVPVLPCLFLCY